MLNGRSSVESRRDLRITPRGIAEWLGRSNMRRLIRERELVFRADSSSRRFDACHQNQRKHHAKRRPAPLASLLKVKKPNSQTSLKSLFGLSALRSVTGLSQPRPEKRNSLNRI